MHELAAYFDLMKEIGVDEVKFRSLIVADDAPPAFKNNGFVFDYEAETLSMRELHELTPVIRKLAESRNVDVYMEWEEFERPQIHVEGEPLCAEPWKTLYVLNRGIMPCAFGARPLAKWNQQGNRKLDDFLRDVFNSDEYQEIRTGARRRPAAAVLPGVAGLPDRQAHVSGRRVRPSEFRATRRLMACGRR